MNLDSTITCVTELTKRLESALEKDDIDDCLDLTEQREAAIQNLAEAYQNASPQQIQARRTELENLALQDQAIRQKFQGVFDRLGNTLDRLRNVRHSITPQEATCINRKA